MPENTLFSYRLKNDSSGLLDPLHPHWQKCDRVSIDRFWNGKPALKEKGINWANMTQVLSAWDEEGISFYCLCWYDQLNVAEEWGSGGPIPHLWEKDVVEVFLRPESCDDYFEFEVSPLGQWLDLHILRPRTEVDEKWRSGLEVRTILEKDRRLWHAFLKIPFEPILKTSCLTAPPGEGNAWRLNLYRAAGVEPRREYLAWRPTFTPEADFHVPWAFGNLIFLDE